VPFYFIFYCYLASLATCAMTLRRGLIDDRSRPSDSRWRQLTPLRDAVGGGRGGKIDSYLLSSCVLAILVSFYSREVIVL
jgi:hypothetical protein